MRQRTINLFPRDMLLEKAISRWDGEGGAGEGGREHPASMSHAVKGLPLSNAELVQLQIRVIALENLLTILLADSSDEQIEFAREMAAYIAPRPGFTSHRLTIHAAARIISLTDRASHLRNLAAMSGKTDKPVNGAHQVATRAQPRGGLQRSGALQRHAREHHGRRRTAHRDRSDGGDRTENTAVGKTQPNKRFHRTPSSGACLLIPH